MPSLPVPSQDGMQQLESRLRETMESELAKLRKQLLEGGLKEMLEKEMAELSQGSHKEMLDKEIAQLRKAFHELLAQRNVELEKQLQSFETVRVDLGALQQEQLSVAAQVRGIDRNQTELKQLAVKVEALDSNQGELRQLAAQVGALDHSQRELQQQLSQLELAFSQGAAQRTSPTLQEKSDQTSGEEHVEHIPGQCRRGIETHNGSLDGVEQSLAKEVQPKLQVIDQKVEANSGRLDGVERLAREVEPKLEGINRRVQELCVRFEEQLPRLEEKIRLSEDLARSALNQTPAMATGSSERSHRHREEGVRMLASLSENEAVLLNDNEVRASRDRHELRVDLVKHALSTMTLDWAMSSQAGSPRSPRSPKRASKASSAFSARSLSRGLSMSKSFSKTMSGNSSVAMSPSESRVFYSFSPEHLLLRLELIRRSLGTFEGFRKLPSWCPRLRSSGRRPSDTAQAMAARSVSAIVGVMRVNPSVDPQSMRRSTVC